MVESTVRISMREENSLDCSYAIIEKSGIAVILILRQRECAVFDYTDLKRSGAASRYLLLKHYPSESLAYTDFLKLIGKLCKKPPDSKYFRRRIDEDNRMVVRAIGSEHMLSSPELPDYRSRLATFLQFVFHHAADF